MAQVVDVVLAHLFAVEPFTYSGEPQQTVTHVRRTAPIGAAAWPHRVPINAFLSVHKF